MALFFPLLCIKHFSENADQDKNPLSAIIKNPDSPVTWSVYTTVTGQTVFL